MGSTKDSEKVVRGKVEQWADTVINAIDDDNGDFDEDLDDDTDCYYDDGDLDGDDDDDDDE
jgi:hypothetical protein